MIMGYGIIAVPTGIVTTELVRAPRGEMTTQACPECGLEDHDSDARFCKGCGGKL
jgi:voltage-gated potassium channel